MGKSIKPKNDMDSEFSSWSDEYSEERCDGASDNESNESESDDGDEVDDNETADFESAASSLQPLDQTFAALAAGAPGSVVCIFSITGP